MVRLVGHDEVEIARLEVSLEAGTARQGLDRTGNDRLAVRVAARLLDAHGAIEVFDRLCHELVPVGQNKHPAVTVDVRERDGLAQSGRHLDQMGTAVQIVDYVDTFRLVIP